jgi:hypothetical protein
VSNGRREANGAKERNRGEERPSCVGARGRPVAWALLAMSAMGRLRSFQLSYLLATPADHRRQRPSGLHNYLRNTVCKRQLRLRTPMFVHTL